MQWARILRQDREAETALRKSIGLFEQTPSATDEQRREPHDALAELVAASRQSDAR